LEDAGPEAPPGPDLISLDELEQVLIRVRDELLEVYPARPKLPEVYHGMPQLIEADARGERYCVLGRRCSSCTTGGGS
jgi:hypothetical protein